MKTLLFGLSLMMVTAGFAQQDPQFSMNMHNKLFPNPGVAGSGDAVCATMLGRHQWMGFEGKPETYLLSIHAPVRPLFGGVGLTITSDKLGSEQTFGLKAAYSFRKAIGVGDLGIGVGVGLLNKSVKDEWISIDPYPLDPSIPDVGASDMGFDLDFGLYYQTSNLYFGLSTTHITQAELTEIKTSTNGLVYKVARHYYVMAGYSARLTPEWELKPSVMAKSDGASTQVDINATAEWNNVLWGGVSYRYQDAIVPMIGMYRPLGSGTFKFGYSYDVTTSALRNYSSGTHELMLGYCFNLPDTPKMIGHKTVRFL